MGRVLAVLLALCSSALVSGCATERGAGSGHAHGATAAANPWTGITKAIAVVHPTERNTVRGTVRFTDVEGGVWVVAEFEGLTPNATHAFHVHEFGDCSGPEGKAAGGHYNPEGHPHAGPDDAMRHAGDLGNVVTDGSGRARVERMFRDLSVAGARNPVLGRSVIIHAAPDDLTTQPTGNAGARIGCGVIGVASTEAGK